MSDIVMVSIAVIIVAVVIRSAYGLGHAAGMVEVKFPLHEALEPYGLYLSRATENVTPMTPEAREEIGLICPTHLEPDFAALRQMLQQEGLDIYLAKSDATIGSAIDQSGA